MRNYFIKFFVLLFASSHSFPFAHFLVCFVLGFIVCLFFPLVGWLELDSFPVDSEEFIFWQE